MANKYFKNFPIINYDGNPSVNILRRVQLNDTIKNYWTAFYPYTQKDGERIEHVAHNYYESVDYDWLIYHTNDITDPFYGAALSSSDFDRFIKKKYTSTRVAQNLVMHYKNNYETDDQVITTSTYDVLTSARKKYWEPVYSYDDFLTGYERKKTKRIVSTNKIQNLTFDAVANGTFVIGEWISSDDDAGLSAQVVWANTSVATIQHIVGDWSSDTVANSHYNFTGEISGAVAVANGDSVTTITEVIPSDELVYYSPVVSYDWEVEQNETKRDLQIIDRGYAYELSKKMKDILE